MLDTENGNPIKADQSGVLYYSFTDSTSMPIEINPTTFRIVPAMTISQTLDLRKNIKRNVNNTVNPINYIMKKAWDDSNNRVTSGVLDNSTGFTADNIPINALVLAAQLSDSFPNPIQIRVIAPNFQKNPGQSVVATLDLPVNSLQNSIMIELGGASLIGGLLKEEIDSLEFNIEVQVLGELAEATSSLKQKLTTSLTVGQLALESFNGRVFATGETPPALVAKSLTGASDIEFDSARASLNIETFGGDFDSVYVRLSGKKVHGVETVSDTMTAINRADLKMDIGEVVSNLPDTVRVFVKVMTATADFERNTVFNAGVNVKYNISVPLRFKIPPQITLASGNTTTYFIKDSTTRARLITSQNGADLDMTVENRTDLQGDLYFLISNFNFFPFDTLGGNLPSDFILFDGTVCHLGDDTTVVEIDTLAVLEFPPAQFSENTLIVPGIKSQIFQISSDAIGLLADTCYFKPYFELVNPDTSLATITATQSIHVRGFLDLYFVATDLKDSD